MHAADIRADLCCIRISLAYSSYNAMHDMHGAVGRALYRQDIGALVRHTLLGVQSNTGR